ncbi:MULTISPECIES: polysaccharide deacetylase family sporulation protein PdaB [unclassified Bacillus (in: firmicutes)]|uniref:polysaccharide deacetylase family sporulation protein PdaB n=1 Tax=unclassified Bacillus (in: firmicutes) TaxID=185979 RepID=UPI001BECD7D8|nr:MULTISPECIES: polysaccharide deacetylase family sporulation protein PdaB [unclassified Bacillus (in: firmicutes)]MBT2639896.1 polysaccharide deacetylase family sporulation protein PdaB [Bacillus sp. ISL-39]MBT2663617.1 polysaccharide deacetylase family sporulation protein PdaB [Bacillus sp. ISL-45]
MNFFYVMNAKSIKTAFVIVIAAFFTAWFFYMENMVQIPAFSAKDGPKAIYKGEKDLALTFNIGWGDEKAAPILDVLKKEKAGAVTFFLSGSWAERHPDLVNRMVKEGYEIGMLGYEYKDYTDLEDDKIRRDILKAQEAFKKLNVKNIALLRAPTGHFDQRTLKIAERLGYTVVHWSLDTKDWTNPGTEVIAANASTAKKGDILLMHASDSAKQTAEALPLVLKDIRSKNLKMVTVSELIANGDSKSAEIK